MDQPNKNRVHAWVFVNAFVSELASTGSHDIWTGSRQCEMWHAMSWS